MSSLVFLPGDGRVADWPLGRFVPPVAQGAIASWLKSNVPSGSWVIDPIGFAPLVPLEAAGAGYQVLVCCNNPILSFMLEVLATAPPQTLLKSALAGLSLLKRGTERLDIHLQSLYQTICPSCKQTIQADAFLWKRGENEPFARIIACPNCGMDGEFPLTQDDINRLALPGNPALHRARALERVNLQDDEIRPGIEEALRAYLPRSLYFITTLINKIEGSGFDPEMRKLCLALVISACDEGNALWSWPAGRQRPRQISIPAQFKENNLWKALEDSIQKWCLQERPIPLTIWPELPSGKDQGGICLYRGRLKSLLARPANIAPQAAITAFPRPSQAFWTLSAVWAGWLWGPEAVHPLKAVLSRLRYDWNWHATALYNTFEALSSMAPKDFPFFGIMPETVPGFAGAVVLAAQSSGFQLQGLSLREDDATTQFCFLRAIPTVSPPPKDTGKPFVSREDIQNQILHYLSARQEPASYLVLYLTALEAAIDAGSLPVLPQDSDARNNLLRYFSDLSRRFEDPFHQALRNPRIFQRFNFTDSEDSGVWFIRDPEASPSETQHTLSDQIEVEIVQYLQQHPGVSTQNIDAAICQAFPGLHTPPSELIQICLESYGTPSTLADSQIWELRSEDHPAARRRDLTSIKNTLDTIAGRLGWQSSGEMPILWKTSTGEVAYELYPIASSIISKWARQESNVPPERRVFVLPGGRSRLLAFKLRRDPYLAELVRDWHFLKFRTLRQLLEQPSGSVENFKNWLDNDPPDLEDARQMSIFDT